MELTRTLCRLNMKKKSKYYAGRSVESSEGKIRGRKGKVQGEFAGDE